MPYISKIWQVYDPISAETSQALQAYHPVLRQILANRGYTDADSAQQFLNALPAQGIDPTQMLGMPAAIERINFAIAHSQPIAVYGDYDADGETATALLVEALGNLGARVSGYIPNRFDEGYGLNMEALDALHEMGVRLVITVDCGIRSLAEAEHARQIGLDLIISDHHHPLHEIPQAAAVINPKQDGDLQQYRDLAGVGLAYQLAAALSTSTQADLQGSLDLVAIGTVADLVPLVGENRSLVRRGIEQIQAARRQGIVSLIGASGLKSYSVSAGDIGYVLAPRLNAAGRLDSALAAYHLLISRDINETGRLAQQLDDQNRERQRITRAIFARAEQIALSEEAQPWLIFAADPTFNPGVVGLAASRLVENYYRPAIVAFIDVETTRASCRSIPEFHITQALDQCADLLEHHGGHAAAAGFTVRNEHLPELIERLRLIAVEQLSSIDLRPVLKADLELPLSGLKPEILAYLSWLQPTGNGNREALFLSRNLKVKYKRTVGKEAYHLKLSVSDGKITYDAIAFRQGHLLDQIGDCVDLMYTFETNEFNGQLFLQLNVRDIRPINA